MQLADRSFTQRDCSSFSFWRDTVCETFVDLDCRQHGSDRFKGQIQSRRLLDVSFATVAATPHTVVRDAQRIARSRTMTTCSASYMKVKWASSSALA